MDYNRDKHGKYIKMLFAGFGAMALAIIFYFLIAKSGDLGGAAGAVTKVFRPFVIGAVMAYILSPLCSKLDKIFLSKNPGKPGRRRKEVSGLSIILSIILLCLIVYLVMMMIVPQLYQSITGIVNTTPARLEAFYNKAEEVLNDNEVLKQYFDAFYAEASVYVSQWIDENIVKNAGSIAGTIISGVGLGFVSFLVFIKDFVIGIIVMIYLLSGRKTFARQGLKAVKAMFRPDLAESVIQEIRYADRMFYSFFSGKLLDSAIVGVICYAFCLIAKMPNALLLAVIIGLTNIIPFFGPFIGAIPSVILIFMESPAKALIFALFIVVLQQVDGNIIGPKIIGNSTGLSSFWVLFAIIVFGGFFGFAGMILGVPLFAVIYDVLRKLVNRGYEANLRLAEASACSSAAGFAEESSEASEE